MNDPSWTDALREYYRSPAVRARIGEYCGGEGDRPETFTCWNLAGYGGRARREEADGGPTPLPNADLEQLFDEGADVCRSLDWSRFRQALIEVGYRGVFMLEVNGNGDIAGHVRTAAEAARRVLNPS